MKPSDVLPNPGDFLTTPGHRNERLYFVAGIHLGALNQEDIVELNVCDRTLPDAHGERIKSLFVPLAMIQFGVAHQLYKLETL